MIERIEQLRAEAREQIAAAADSAELERLRVAWLGRRAELPLLLRSVGELAPQERGPVGRAANEARRELEALLDERARELNASELETKIEAGALDVTLPGAPPSPVGSLHILTRTRRELEDIFLGLGFTVIEGPQVETVHYNFDALNHSPDAPRTRPHRHLLRLRRHGAAHTHLADAGARHGSAPAAALRRDPRARLPARLRRHSHAAVPPDRGIRGRRGHHARGPEGNAPGVRAGRLRRPARGTPSPALLPLHRAQRGGRRLVLQLRGPRHAARRLALPALQGRGVAGGARAPARSTRMSSPPCRTPKRTRPDTTPSAFAASRGGWGSSASRCFATAFRTCA